MRARQIILAEHCYHHPELPASQLILCEPTHSKPNRGRTPTTLLKTLLMEGGVLIMFNTFLTFDKVFNLGKKMNRPVQVGSDPAHWPLLPQVLEDGPSM